MKLITISGVDGSGKSTQVEMLKKHFESQGKKVFYFHAIEFGLAKKLNDFRLKYCLICRFLNACKTKKHSEGVTRANILQIFLRRVFLMIDIFRFKSLYKKLESEDYGYILSDRYFYDSLINIEYLALRRNPKAELSDFLKLGFRIPRPDTTIYLQVDPEAIMQRERKPEQGLEYLQKKKALFDAKTQIQPFWTILDGNQPKESLFEAIKPLVE